MIIPDPHAGFENLIILPLPMNGARINAIADDDGVWHLAVTIGGQQIRPDGRLTTTTFWTPFTPPDQEPGEVNLDDILDAIILIAARKANDD